MATGDIAPQVKMVYRKKAELVSNFKGLKHQEAGFTVLELLNLLINDLRIDNDTADINMVLRNQGRLAALIELRDYLEREPINYAGRQL